MKTIRVYGDSFAANTFDFCWPTILGNSLSLPVENNAMLGSCTEYAIKTFIKDVQNNIIGDDDIIIYVPSSTLRLNLSPQLDKNKKPNTSVYSQGLDNPNGKGPQDEWYQENKKYIDWWVVNYDQEMQEFQFESYIQLLQNFARNRPNCVVIVLPAFPIGLFKDEKHPTDIFNKHSTNNFLRVNICLRNVSVLERIDSPDLKQFVRFTGWDPRCNHLTLPNLYILANLLSEAIQTLNIDNITMDKFQTKNIKCIETKEEYLKCVSNNIVPYSKKIEDNFK